MRYAPILFFICSSCFAQATITDNSPGGTGTWTTADTLTFDIDYDTAGYSFIDWDHTLELWWKFDDPLNGTSIRDWSGKGHTGTTTSNFISSDYGTAIDAQASISDDAGAGRFMFFRDDQDVTFFFRGRTTSGHGHQDMFQISGSGNLLRCFVHTGEAACWLQLNDGYQTTLPASESASVFPLDNAWHTLALVLRKPDTVLWYIDGSLDDTDVLATDMGSWNIDALTVGGTYFLWDGDIDDFLIFNRELSAAEIEALDDIQSSNLTCTQTVNELDTHQYRIYHVDSNGLVSDTDEAIVTIDGASTAPEVTLLGPSGGSKVTGTSALLQFRAKSTTVGTNLASAYIEWGIGSLTENDTIALSGPQKKVGYQLTGLTASSTYVWNVTVTDGDTNSGDGGSNATFDTSSQNEYHVQPAPTGDDGNPGTLASPFETIQHFCGIAKPGDTCYVHAGTYREAVSMTTSGTITEPITIQAYDTDTVTISGLDVVGDDVTDDWTLDSGSVYTATITSLGRGLNQVFEDGAVVLEARYPNQTGLFESGTRTAYDIDAGSSYSGTDVTLVASELTQADNYWVGATIHMIYSPRYHASTALVSASSQAGTSLTATSDMATLTGSGTMTDYGLFYLCGSVNCIDQAGEWAVSGNTLYLWDSDSSDPDTKTIEVKSRETGLTLDCSYVTVSGIDVKGCEVEFSRDSSHCIVDDATITYSSHYAIITDSDAASGLHGVRDTGVIIDGDHNKLTNSTIEYSAGNCVSLLGHNNVVDNCSLGYADYMVTEAACVNFGKQGAYGNVVSNCTLYNSSRANLNWSGAVNTSIVNNTFYGAQYDDWAWDTGPTYTISTRGNGLFAYNYFRDWGQEIPGPYWDASSWNYVIHDNIIEDGGYSDIGMLINEQGGGFQIYHNTLEDNLWFDEQAGYKTSGNFIYNNIYNDRVGNASFASDEGIESNNIEINTLSAPEQAALFTDQSNDDFTLGGSSAAIDYGADIGFTANDYAGNTRPQGTAPDAGAYERE